MSFSVEDFGRLSVIVVMHTAATPPLPDWARFEEEIKRHKRQSGADFQRLRSLVISDGGAPTTQQRHEMLTVIWEGRPMKGALLTNSLKNPIKRGIATALTWLNPNFKICVPTDFRGALVHLELLDGLERCWDACRRLQSEMPRLETLASIADTLGRPRLPAQLPAA
jgi:hypothetical protein